jgi:hypothetical protein
VVRNFIFICILFISVINDTFCQSLFPSTFRFLDIPQSSRHQYLNKGAGGAYDYDAMIAGANPSLIHDEMRGKLLASTNFYFNSIYSNIAYFTANDKFDIPLMIGGNFIAYPEQQSTDIDGNRGIPFTPIELSLYAAGAHQIDKYRFGGQAKLIYGNYLLANNIGVAFDASCMYIDDLRNIQFALILKNMGYQFAGFGSSNNATPFDIQLIFSKRLERLPFRYTITAYNIYQWDSDNFTTDYGIWPLDPFYERNNTTLNRILNHFVFSGEFFIGSGFKMGFSYDFKRANELQFTEFYRGIPGVAMGLGIYGKKYELGYSFSKLSAAGAAHQITFIANLRDWAVRKKR